MVFSSLLFLFRFLPIVLLAYYIMPKQGKNLVLFLASLFFYAWGEPVYVLIMIFSTIVDYTHGRMVERLIKQDKRKKAKWVVASSMCINLALLGFFKYADFLIGNINAIFGTAIGIWTSMYIFFTPVGFSGINGVQARYFVPLLIPLYLLFNTKYIQNNIPKRVYHVLCIMLPLFITSGMMFVLMTVLSK